MKARWLALCLLFGCSSEPADDSPAGHGGSVSSEGGSGQGGAAIDAGSGGAVSQGGSGGQTSSGGAAGQAGAAGEGGAAGTSGTGGSAGAQCTDSYPYTDGYTCSQQAAWGKCGEDWLKSACDLSCGRCGGGPDCVTVGPDPCPMGTGLTHACRQRFALGVNYAWHSFAGDFGGIPQWNQQSISQAPAVYDADLALMRANGASVVRWWVFPDFRGAGVLFDANGDPTGISDTARADVEKALELAEKNDLYLVLTIFSFDNFRPDHESYGIMIRGLQPIVSNPQRRAKLIDNVVRPLARAAGQSPRASRLLGWDLVNEPEWAIAATGTAPAGGDFSPSDDMAPVSLQDMKSLLNEMNVVLAAETPSALKSVGWAAAKWSWAFQDVAGLDFHQPHIYAWVNDWWPYTSTPAQLGYGSKPTVIGECYLQDHPFSNGTSFATVAASLFSNGYAGFWPWDFYSGNVKDPPDTSFDLGLIKSFADEKGCQATFVPNPPAPPPPQKLSSSGASIDEAAFQSWQAIEQLRKTDKNKALEHAMRGTSRGRAGEAREAMIITLLVELGRMPEARQRTRRFLTEHPESSYRMLVQGLTGIHPRPGKPIAR